jgi:hypothetical protein
VAGSLPTRLLISPTQKNCSKVCRKVKSSIFVHRCGLTLLATNNLNAHWQKADVRPCEYVDGHIYFTMAKKKIPQFEHYSVDEYGVVINEKTGRIRKKGKNKKGYELVMLSNNGITKSFVVHRLVYECFVGEIPDKLEINHIDANKSNNHISNLELVTHTENIQKAVEMGLFRSGATHKLSKKIVAMDRNFEHYNFDSIGQACKALKLRHTDIWRVLTRKCKTAKGYEFYYWEDFYGTEEERLRCPF